MLELSSEGEVRLAAVHLGPCYPTIQPYPSLPPQQPRDRGMGRDTQQALGALIAVMTEQLQVIPTPGSQLPH